jgi:hypothetical protein
LATSSTKTSLNFSIFVSSSYPYNVESWKVFPSDEIICDFIQNEPYKPKEIISMEDNKILKGLTPLESSFSSSDVGKKEKNKEEESKRKVGETISLNIGTPDCPNNVKIGDQCTDGKKLKFIELLHEFQYVFSCLMRIFMALILLIYNIPSLSRKA